MQSGVLGLVDRTHTTLTDLVDDLILPDGLADHRLSAILEAIYLFEPIDNYLNLIDCLLLRTLYY